MSKPQPIPAPYIPQPFSTMPAWKLCNIITNDCHNKQAAYDELVKRGHNQAALENLKSFL